MDADVKQSFDRFCNELGMTMSTAFNLFAKTSLRESRIPFELAIDPFYTEADLRRIHQATWEEEHGVPGIRKTFEELGITENA